MIVSECAVRAQNLLGHYGSRTDIAIGDISGKLPNSFQMMFRRYIFSRAIFWESGPLSSHWQLTSYHNEEVRIKM